MDEIRRLGGGCVREVVVGCWCNDEREDVEWNSDGCIEVIESNNEATNTKFAR
jgi:hypothetical protein